jgi:hypothetical protein
VFQVALSSRLECKFKIMCLMCDTVLYSRVCKVPLDEDHAISPQVSRGLDLPWHGVPDEADVNGM